MRILTLYRLSVVPDPLRRVRERLDLLIVMKSRQAAEEGHADRADQRKRSD